MAKKKKETFVDRRNRLLKSKGGQIKEKPVGQAISGGADRGGLAGRIISKKRKK